MYLDEIRHPQHRTVLAAMRRWAAAAHALGALRQLRRLLAIDRSDAAATFHLHRAPARDTLGW